MKTLKSILAGIVLLFACAGANAAVKAHKSQPTESDVVTMYINAVKSGKIDNLDKILETEMQFNVQRGQNVNTFNKDQFINYLKNSNVSDSVPTTTTVLADDEYTGKVKVEFKYDGYTRVDIVNLDKSTGWRISSVNSSYK